MKEAQDDMTSPIYSTTAEAGISQSADSQQLEQIVRDCRWEYFDFSDLEEDCCIDCVAKRRYELTKVGLTETETLLLDAKDPAVIRTAYRVLAKNLQREVEILQRVEETLAIAEHQRMRADEHRKTAKKSASQ